MVPVQEFDIASSVVQSATMLFAAQEAMVIVLLPPVVPAWHAVTLHLSAVAERAMPQGMWQIFRHASSQSTRIVVVDVQFTFITLALVYEFGQTIGPAIYPHIIEASC